MWYQVKQNENIVYATQNALEINEYLEGKEVVTTNYDVENNFLYVTIE